MAEQAQAKLDEAQKQFNAGQQQGQPSGPAVEYDKHGRPIPQAPARDRAAAAARRPAARGSQAPPAPPRRRADARRPADRPRRPGRRAAPPPAPPVAQPGVPPTRRTARPGRAPAGGPAGPAGGRRARRGPQPPELRAAQALQRRPARRLTSALARRGLGAACETVAHAAVRRTADRDGHAVPRRRARQRRRGRRDRPPPAGERLPRPRRRRHDRRGRHAHRRRAGPPRRADRRRGRPRRRDRRRRRLQRHAPRDRAHPARRSPRAPRPSCRSRRTTTSRTGAASCATSRRSRARPRARRWSLYNIPGRTAVNMGPDLLAELAQIDGIVGVKQANCGRAAADRRPGRARRQRRHLRAPASTWAARAASASPRTSSARRCAACTTSPSARAEIDASLRDVYDDAVHHGQPDAGQGGAEPARATTPARCGCRWSRPTRPRPPPCAPCSRATACSPPCPRVSGTLRVLPLGGVGEIGKNMTVVEYDGRIVLVDAGLRFPTAEQMGIDLVLPDFAYLRDRTDDIEAIVITHGHEDHLGALPWLLRELGEESIPVTYGGQLTVAMARSKLDEHKLRKARLDVLPTGEPVQAGPFTIEMIHLTHSIPDACGVALTTELGTVLVHRRLQVRPDAGRRRAGGRVAARRARPRGPAAARRRLHERRPRGLLDQRVDRRAEPRARLPALRGPDRRHLLRVEHPPRAAGRRRGRALGRKVALVGRSMRKNVNIGRSLGHINVPEGMLIPLREVDQWADEKLVIVSTGLPGRAAVGAAPHGLPRPPAGRAAAPATPSSSPPPRSRATSARSTTRSTGSTTSAPRSSRPATRRSTPPDTGSRRRSS